MKEILIYSLSVIGVYYYIFIGIELYKKWYMSRIINWVWQSFTFRQKLPLYLAYAFAWPLFVLFRIFFSLIKPLF